MVQFAELEGRGIVTVSGDDREFFLQGLVSNDVSPAMAGRAVWAAFLTPQGKYRHDFFVVGQGDRLLLDCEGGDRMMDLGRSLRKFLLRSDVTLGIEQGLGCFAVWGDDAARALSIPEEPGAAVAFAGGRAFVDPRLSAMGARVLAPVDEARAALTALGISGTSPGEWHANRIVHGVPDGSRDLDVDKTILMEAGFEELKGVDWQKGCFMGQELTARTKYRGLVKKRLAPVVVTGGDIEPGDDVLAGERVVGGIRSVSADRAMALALLRLEAIDGSAGPLTVGVASVRPALPAWFAVPARIEP